MRPSRRDLLVAVMGALAAPPLAFAGVSAPQRLHGFVAAWGRAAQHRHPLLVIVIPNDVGLWRARGTSLGCWLTQMEREDLAWLANVEPVCVTLDELRRFLPGVDPAATFVVVQTDRALGLAQSVLVTEPVAPEPDLRRAMSYLDGRLPEERAYVRALVSAYNTALFPALVRAAVGRGDPQVAEDKWLVHAPPGAHWGVASCGVWYRELAPQVTGIECGMASLSWYAKTFLEFNDLVSSAAGVEHAG